MVINIRQVDVPEDRARLLRLDIKSGESPVDDAVRALKADMVVLITDLEAPQADRILQEVAEQFRLKDKLDMQASFANILGHRTNVQDHFMTVNEREEFQIVSPHSEGSRMMDMQLAAFFCYENTTDGGDTVLMNVNQASQELRSTLELVRKGSVNGGRPLTAREKWMAKAIYKIEFPKDILDDGARITSEYDSDIVDLKVYDVLVPVLPSYSKILDREVYVYWDTVGTVDIDSAFEFYALLSENDLLRQPTGGIDVSKADADFRRRVWRSGLKYCDLFASRITHKLKKGELVILNNMTWAHGVSNWTPDSGTRSVVAAFA